MALKRNLPALAASLLVGGLVACEQSTAPAVDEAAPALDEELALPDRLASSRDAVADLIKDCDSGDGIACNVLGQHYLARPGAAKTAGERFVAACRAGVQEGCNNQAVMALREKGKVKKALQQAGDLFQKACDNGVPAACGNLAWMLQDAMKGAGERAVSVARKGCAAGDRRACVLVARGLATGAKPDAAAARAALEDLCAAKSAEACRLLGEEAPKVDDFLDEIEPIKDPFACSDEEWLARVAGAMKLEGFVRDPKAPAPEADCDQWRIR